MIYASIIKPRGLPPPWTPRAFRQRSLTRLPRGFRYQLQSRPILHRPARGASGSTSSVLPGRQLWPPRALPRPALGPCSPLSSPFLGSPGRGLLAPEALPTPLLRRLSTARCTIAVIGKRQVPSAGDVEEMSSCSVFSTAVPLVSSSAARAPSAVP